MRPPAAGTIDAAGRYTPPSYLTADSAEVTVTARLEDNPAAAGQRPSDGDPRISATADAGKRSAGHQWNADLDRPPGRGGRQSGHPVCARRGSERCFGAGNPSLGVLGPTTCERTARRLPLAPSPTCAVLYPVHRRGLCCREAGNSRTETAVLLNTAGVTSNPVAHQGEMGRYCRWAARAATTPTMTRAATPIVDCCSGTLGALVEDNSGRAVPAEQQPRAGQERSRQRSATRSCSRD